MSGIVTVTLNPALDKTAAISKLVPGGLNRLENIVLDAGGKGINVSKMIFAIGGSSVASGFLGGGSGDEIERTLGKLGIKTDFVKISQPTRTNLKVLCDEHGITEFNEPGAFVSAEELGALKEKLLGLTKPGMLFVFSGSLPRGIEPDVYAALIRAVKEKGAAVFLDADGAAFKAAVEANPDYIKPNLFELTQYFGETIKPSAAPEEKLDFCAVLCRRLIDKGIKIVTVSMGAEGAMFVTETEELYAPGLKLKALSTVGAGDSMVGALVYAFQKGMPLTEAAALGLAASAGAVTTEGTKPPSRDLVDNLIKQVRILRRGIL